MLCCKAYIAYVGLSKLSYYPQTHWEHCLKLPRNTECIVKNASVYMPNYHMTNKHSQTCVVFSSIGPQKDWCNSINKCTKCCPDIMSRYLCQRGLLEHNQMLDLSQLLLSSFHLQSAVAGGQWQLSWIQFNVYDTIIVLLITSDFGELI